MKIRVLIVNDNQESLRSLKDLLEPFSEFKVSGEAGGGKASAEMVRLFKPDIVVMDTKMPDMDGFSACKEITQSAPYIGVILVGLEDNAEVMRRAMQCGAGDYLKLPLVGGRLREAIFSLYSLKSEQRSRLAGHDLTNEQRRPKIISMFSCKGGVGKTVLGINLAVAIKEKTREDVLLIDLGLPFGDVANMLNLNPKSSIVDLLADLENIETSEISKYITPHHTGVKILPASPRVEDAEQLEEKGIEKLLSLFATVFDYILIDLPSLFNNTVLEALQRSDHILLVATNEVPTLKKTREILEIFRKLEFPAAKTTLLANRLRNKEGIKAGNIKKFLEAGEIIPVNDDPLVVNTSINLGEPLVLTHKEAKVAKQIWQLASILIEHERFESNKNTRFRFLRKGG